MNRTFINTRLNAQHQSGMVTTFTAVMILVLLTLMMFFAIRVGVFEQRVSSNEMRQKEAFHAAESGIQQAKEFFKANVVIAGSIYENILSDGTDGWLSPGHERWQPCSGAGIDLTASGTHPCLSEPDVALRSNLYYWSHENSLNVPLATGGVWSGNEEVIDVQALLCLLEIDYDQDPIVQGCSTDTTVVDGRRYMITLISRGQSDCVNGANCNAESVVREMVANFGGAAGGQTPNVPLTTKSTFPPSGTAELVANPNGGGVGVPTSVWMNGNARCSTNGAIIDPSSGSWSTCEAYEWYGTERVPDDALCPGNCSCSADEALSFNDSLGIDLIQDADFPCDLFQFYFGTPRDNYEAIKSIAKIINDCDSLGPSSQGIYWVSGPECDINSNTVIGSAKAPVLLVSAASVTRFNGGANFFGVLYVADVEDPDAIMQANGTNTVYGQVILDATLDRYNGTFQVVYNENILDFANGTGALGNVLGGWTDIHPDGWHFQ